MIKIAVVLVAALALAAPDAHAEDVPAKTRKLALEEVNANMLPGFFEVVRSGVSDVWAGTTLDCRPTRQGTFCEYRTVYRVRSREGRVARIEVGGVIVRHGRARTADKHQRQSLAMRRGLTDR